MTQTVAFVLLALVAGLLLPLQAPINASLGRIIGPLEASWVSFAVGWTVLTMVLVLAGRGSLRAVTDASPWQLTGGVIGALFVASATLVLPRIGATGFLVTSILGQVLASTVVDARGWFGLPVRGLDAQRVTGVVLLLAATVALNAPKR